MGMFCEIMTSWEVNRIYVQERSMMLLRLLEREEQMRKMKE